MIKNKIKIGFLTFIFLFSQIGTPFLTFANDTTTATPKCNAMAPVCIQTPDSLNLYLNFQREIIGLMSSDPFQTIAEQIDLGEGGLFTNKLLKLSNPNANTNLPILTDLLKELETSITNLLIGNTTTAGLFLLSAISVGSDGLMSFAILFQERPIVRDRSKLLNIERSISQAAYNLGNKGKIGKTIKDTSKINNIIQKYQQEGLLGSDSLFPQKNTYLDILVELMRINTNLKFFLSIGSTYYLTSPNSTIKFSPERTEKLKSEYQCARFTLGFKCNPPGYALLANLKTLTSNTTRTKKSAIYTIKTALKKLNESIKGFKNFRSNKEKSLTSNELELLRSVYGLDTTKLTDEQLSSLSLLSISQRTKNQYEEVKKEANNVAKMPEGIYKMLTSPLTTLKEQTFQARNQLLEIEAEKFNIQAQNIDTLSKDEKKQLKTEIAKRKTAEQMLLSGFITEAYELKNKNKENIQLHSEMFTSLQELINAEINIKEETSLNNNILTTNHFGIISQQIIQISEAIGNKKQGTRKALNEICRYQCNNYQSTSCYIP